MTITPNIDQELQAKREIEHFNWRKERWANKSNRDKVIDLMINNPRTRYANLRYSWAETVSRRVWTYWANKLVEEGDAVVTQHVKGLFKWKTYIFTGIPF